MARRFGLYPLAVFCWAACSSPSPSAQVQIDARALLRQAQTSGPSLSALGLLVVSTPQPTVEEAKRAVETAEGEAASAAPVEAVTEVRTSEKTVVKEGTATSSGTTTDTRSTAVRQLDERTDDVTAIANSTASGTEQGATFTYLPIDLANAEAGSFVVDVPAGRQQRLYLIGFVDNASGLRVPAYIGLHVGNLLPLTEYDVTFSVYPAGVVRPLVAVNTVGLRTATGDAFKIPEAANCVGVAKALIPREAFPAEVAVRVPIGALSDVATDQKALAGYFVLPVGEYALSCLANFDGQIFGSSEEKAPVVRVGQGLVATPSLSLQRVKVLDPTVVAPADPTLPPEEPTRKPKLNIEMLRQLMLARELGPARQIASGGGAGQQAMAEESVVNTTNDLDVALRVSALLPNGAVDSSFSGTVRLKVEGELPLDWQPFQRSEALGSGATVDVGVVGGVGRAAEPLSLKTLSILVGGTRSLVITAQLLDADGRPLAISGANYFSVRRPADPQCDQLKQLSRVQLFAPGLTGSVFVTKPLSGGGYSAVPRKDLLVILLASGSSTRSEGCAFFSSSQTKVEFELEETAFPLGVTQVFTIDGTQMTVSGNQASLLIPAGISQVYLRDLIGIDPSVFDKRPSSGDELKQRVLLRPFDSQQFAAPPTFDLSLRVD